MFSWFLVDGLRVLAKQWSCSTIFLWTSNCSLYVQLKLFFIRRTQLFFICRTQLFFILQTQTVLYTLNSNCSLFIELNCSCCAELKVIHSTLQPVYSTQSMGPSILNTYSVKSSIILYSALCSRTSLYPVSRLYTTLDPATLNYCCTY